jgi:hypothetical protein
MSATEGTYPPIQLSWDLVVDHFLMLANNVFEKGDKKAFFDAGALDVNLKDYSKAEQAKIKKSRMVEGGKRRWWELLLLDALGLYSDGNEGKDYKDGKLQKIQRQHESLTNPKGQGKPRRSFNQHLALQLAVWNAFCDAVTGPEYAGLLDAEDLPTIHVGELKELQYDSFDAIKIRLMNDHSDQLAGGHPSSKVVEVSTSSSLDDGGNDANANANEASKSESTTRELPGVVTKKSTYVKQISGERWLQKLETLTAYTGNLENIAIDYVRATIKLLRKHHPAQRTPFMESITNKKGHKIGSITAGLRSGKKPKGKSTKAVQKKKHRKRQRKRRNNDEYYYDSEETSDDEPPPEEEEEEDALYYYEDDRDPEAMENGEDDGGHQGYGRGMRVRAKTAVKRPRLISDYVSGVDLSGHTYEAGACIEARDNMSVDQEQVQDQPPPPRSSLSLATTVNMTESSSLSLMLPWDCDMYSAQQVDYHHNLVQTSGFQFDSSHDVISMGFSPFASGRSGTAPLPSSPLEPQHQSLQQPQQQPPQQQPFSFVAMQTQTQYLATLEEKMSSRDQVTVATLLAEKRQVGGDKNALDLQVQSTA